MLREKSYWLVLILNVRSKYVTSYYNICMSLSCCVCVVILPILLYVCSHTTRLEQVPLEKMLRGATGEDIFTHTHTHTHTHIIYVYI